MKFLCIECDEPMKFAAAGDIDEGSLPVSFRCPSCDWGFTMLTNPQETQLVRTLGVKIGGATVPAEPMGMMREFLAGGHPSMPTGSSEAAGVSSGKCPFASVVNQADESS